jgi:hypothetical protein
MPNVGVIGRARVGKDTAGAWLVENRGFHRVAFADPLKDAALRLNPIAMHDDVFGEYRLREIVVADGWEKAKEYPEIRRILQELGASVRAIDPDFWLRAALKTVQEVNEAGRPAVITDVRYPNEAEALKRAGFHLVYIDRPGVPHLDHESEGALTAGDAKYYIRNGRTLADFLEDVEYVANHIHDYESARQYSRSYD